MGFTSIWHWVIVLIVVLVLFGGKGKLSALMGDFGKGLKNFKDQIKSKNDKIEDAIDSDCPLSSASFPGKAPAVSTNDISGNLNFSANFNNL